MYNGSWLVTMRKLGPGGFDLVCLAAMVNGLSAEQLAGLLTKTGACRLRGNVLGENAEALWRFLALWGVAAGLFSPATAILGVTDGEFLEGGVGFGPRPVAEVIAVHELVDGGHMASPQERPLSSAEGERFIVRVEALCASFGAGQ